MTPTDVTWIPDPADETTGEALTRMFQERMGRRLDDDGRPRAIRWDDETRQTIAQFVDEIMKHVDSRVDRKLGVPAHVHVEHHHDWGELVEYLRSMKRKADRWSELLQKITEVILIDGVRWAVKWGLLLVFLSLALGLSGAWDLILSSITP